KLSLALSAGDLWAGGLETMVATMCWAVLYLLNYPDVQKKLHNELSERLGDRAFRMADRRELPYLRAFIDELQRIINVLPWNLPHSVSEEVVLCGRWRVPADTRVMPQVGAVHLDPELFPDPELFRPDRFLDSHGNYTAPVWLKPFGVGKRMCLGESLAKMEMFIILAALVQNFEFTTLYPNEAPSLRRNNGLANIPDRFECVIRLRPSEPILCKPNDA
uniref:Cytochrome P450 n=1 Tax=Globodera pallida TaxID=36090 RepID=A0A183CMH5_GLOPA